METSILLFWVFIHPLFGVIGLNLERPETIPSTSYNANWLLLWQVWLWATVHELIGGVRVYNHQPPGLHETTTLALVMMVILILWNQITKRYYLMMMMMISLISLWWCWWWWWYLKQLYSFISATCSPPYSRPRSWRTRRPATSCRLRRWLGRVAFGQEFADSGKAVFSQQ